MQEREGEVLQSPREDTVGLWEPRWDAWSPGSRTFHGAEWARDRRLATVSLGVTSCGGNTYYWALIMSFSQPLSPSLSLHGGQSRHRIPRPPSGRLLSTWPDQSSTTFTKRGVWVSWDIFFLTPHEPTVRGCSPEGSSLPRVTR